MPPHRSNRRHRFRQAFTAAAGAALLIAATQSSPASAQTAAAHHAAAGAGTVHPAKSPTCDSTWFPHVNNLVPNTGLDNEFNTYAASAGPGDWVGGDNTYSAVLPDGRTVWLYSDTFTGPVNPDGSIAASGNFIHNSIIVDNHGTLSTIRGGTASAPDSLISPTTPGDWYWADAVQIAGGALQVVYLEFKQTGTGPFDFAWQRNVLVRYSLADLHLLNITMLPSDVANVEWNPWLQRVGNYTYIYGVEDTGAPTFPNKYMRIARVLGTDLRGAWTYWTGTTWSTQQADATRVLANVGNNYSLSVIGGVYTLVTQDTSTPFSDQMVMYFSCSPTGPFTNETLLYIPPEVGASGTYHNSNVIFYNVHEQTQFRSGNNLVFSYDLNSLNPADVHADVSIYRARFFTVSFVVPT
jgi:hypothetical protein